MYTNTFMNILIRIIADIFQILCSRFNSTKQSEEPRFPYIDRGSDNTVG